MIIGSVVYKLLIMISTLLSLQITVLFIVAINLKDMELLIENNEIERKTM